MLATCIIITVLEFDCTVLRAGERGDCGCYAAAVVERGITVSE